MKAAIVSSAYAWQRGSILPADYLGHVARAEAEVDKAAEAVKRAIARQGRALAALDAARKLEAELASSGKLLPIRGA